MKIVVDINHPAHVHYFKNFIWEMEKRGHEVLITASEKEVSYSLLDNYGFNYIKIGNYGKSIWEKAINIPGLDLKMYQAVRKFQPDIFLGHGSIRAAHISKILGKPCIALDDTEHATWEHLLYVPFTDVILTPSCFKKDYGQKHIRFKGSLELASLHPNRFNPDSAVLEELGLEKSDNIFLIRFAAFNASHDTKSENFSKRYIPDLISKLGDKGRIVISSEVNLDSYLQKYQYKLSPEKYHDLLYFSKLYIGEGSTSAVEAALLGTPSINFERIVIKGKKYTFADFSGVLAKYQDKYHLVQCFYDEVMMLERIDEIIQLGFDKVKMQANKNKEKLLNDTIDVTGFLVWFIEQYPKSFDQMKKDPKIQEKFSNKNIFKGMVK